MNFRGLPKELFDQLSGLCEGFRDPRHVGPPGLGEVGAAAPTSADNRGERLDEVPGMNPSHQVLGDRHDERHPAVVG